MTIIKKADSEPRKDYLFRVAIEYLKSIRDSGYSDALSILLTWDDADCDGECLIDDMENAIS